MKSITAILMQIGAHECLGRNQTLAGFWCANYLNHMVALVYSETHFFLPLRGHA